MINEDFVKTITSEKEYKFRFSICTLVTNPAEYSEMLASFIAAGFDTGFCEYLCVDNSNTNTLDAFAGINRFLREAKGEYIIFCHQDIILHDHGLEFLDLRILEMNGIDPKWAVLSNAGGINFKYLAAHLTQGSGNQLLETLLPLKAHSVDENFMLVKASAGLSISNNLKGFHLYGTDICILAEILGFTAYVIEFNLTHKSDGNADHHFKKLRLELMQKYRRALRGRFMSTTITRFYISGNRFGFWFFNTSIMLFLVRQYYKFFRRKANYTVKFKEA